MDAALRLLRDVVRLFRDLVRLLRELIAGARSGWGVAIRIALVLGALTVTCVAFYLVISGVDHLVTHVIAWRL